MLIVLAVDGYATLLERVISNKIGGISVERLTYDFCIAGKHYWQVKGADDLECSEVCRSRDDEGCNGCPIANAFDRLAAIEDILGDDYDLDRLKELVQADREGRCAKLPCKEFFSMLGGDVYAIDDDEVLEVLLCGVGYDPDGIDFIDAVYAPGCEDEKGFTFRFSDVGKTIFLTREEAEAALEKMKEKDKQ